MTVKHYFSGCCWAAICLISLAGCEKRPVPHTDFTKADSLTEIYLSLQDTMLQVWNTMVYDDNRKLKAMEQLLQELRAANPDQRDPLMHLETRLHDLASMRYDQSSLSRSEIVSEYDFASNALITEIIALAESQTAFARNITIQKLADEIRAADQRVDIYREAYDRTVRQFNAFIEENHWALELIEDDSLAKKPLFQMNL